MFRIGIGECMYPSVSVKRTRNQSHFVSGALFHDAFLSLLDWSDFHVLGCTLVPVYAVSFMCK